MKFIINLVVFFLSISIFAANPIPTGRYIDWSKCGVGSGSGIPNRTTVYTTLTPANTAGDLNSAILSCPTNEVILLTAGNYYFNSVINWTNGGQHGNFITIRGAGSGQTIIHFTNSTYSIGDGYIWLQGSDSFDERANGYSIASGYTQGSTNLTLSTAIVDTPLPQPGDIIWLDQVYNTNNITPIGWGESTPAHAMLNRGNDPSGYRVQVQGFAIYSISGTSLKTTTPVYMNNYDSVHLPQVFRGEGHGANHGGSNPAGCRGIGLEGFTVIANTNDNMGSVITMEWANDCWVKDVTSFGGGSVQHITLAVCKNVSVFDSYFFGSRSTGSENYGIEIEESSDCLFQNNILNSITTPIFVDTGSEGCVISYNYVTNVLYNGGAGWFAAGIGIAHGAHPCMNLFEGNYGIGFVADNVHGSSSDNTLFRNSSLGYLTGKTQQTYALSIQAHGERYNIVGNVLGVNGYHTTYEDTCVNLTNIVSSIYALGYWGNFSLTNGTPYTWGFYTNDPGVVTSIFRHGNYDYATHSVVWDSGTADHSLPSSLYLSKKPIWFGNAQFPPIGSDLTPMVSQTPAELRFENIKYLPSGTFMGGKFHLGGNYKIK